ncbi:Otogelin-like protein [Microtus ochrogaster]|uniref:Otogelin-like protein n=1 Tax=Microtus ochrogaster TaxID=79684 RepID=A0A8J6KR37_MICOH|nr:Otogelin-like protein [Microtus ochrogaster]
MMMKLTAGQPPSTREPVLTLAFPFKTGGMTSQHACSVVGDSHFTTFDGRHYSFIGLCQYILVKGTGKDKFTITLQKAHCEQNLGLVCLQSITLILEDDFNKQVTLSRGGQILTSPNHGFTLNVGYAAHCDVIHQELFAPCHVYVSPGLYYQLCRHDACKCGSSCLCNALAHYAYLCAQRGVPIDFRSQISFCAVVCQKGMLYHHCSSFCLRSCTSLSSPEQCDDDCAEGCNCPEGKFYEDTLNFCVPM